MRMERGGRGGEIFSDLGFHLEVGDADDFGV